MKALRPRNTVVVGHRGAGKTSFVRRAQGYLRSAGKRVRAADLDDSIESKDGRRIADIFAAEGESGFRALERRCWAGLAAQAERTSLPWLVSVGAGWTGPAAKGWDCLWIRRPTDPDGRVFLDRPRLDPGLDPMREYLGRFGERERRYRSWATDVLTVPEGWDRPNGPERGFVLGSLKGLGGALTLLPWRLSDEARCRAYLQSRLGWGVGLFELRDDLLGERPMRRAALRLPDERVLASFRDPRRTASTRRLIGRRRVLWDWPVERGRCPFGPAPVLSLHERAARRSLSGCLARLDRWDDGRCLLKAALPTASIQELSEGDAWRREDPLRRTFLPVSQDGRWSWYRLLNRRRSRLNFFREDGGSAPDQPCLMEWAAVPDGGGEFAAVLGDPVRHSRTPAEHGDFFRSRGMPVAAIRMDDEDWRRGGLQALRGLGLAFAAVTSPLKAAAARTLRLPGSVNTLAWDKRRGVWTGVDTDVKGLEALLSGTDARRAAVWGGGGTLPALRRVLPRARYYSARTGKPRPGSAAAPGFKPEVVVWASPRRHGRVLARRPPPAWKPVKVVDLNYSEGSPGREYALRCGAVYVSGLRMFREQAREQRSFWREYDRA